MSSEQGQGNNKQMFVVNKNAYKMQSKMLSHISEMEVVINKINFEC